MTAIGARLLKLGPKLVRLGKRPAEGRTSRDAGRDEEHRAEVLGLRAKRLAKLPKDLRTLLDEEALAARRALRALPADVEPGAGAVLADHLGRSQLFPEEQIPAENLIIGPWPGGPSPLERMRTRVRKLRELSGRRLVVPSKDGAPEIDYADAYGPAWERLARRRLPPDKAQPCARWAALRDAGRWIQPQERRAVCGWSRIGEVGIVQRPDESGYGLASVSRCCDCHGCPVCAATIKGKRAAEIIRGVTLQRQHLGEDSVTMLTLTIRHQEGDDLGKLAEGYQLAWNEFRTRMSAEDKQTRADARAAKYELLKAAGVPWKEARRLAGEDLPAEVWERAALLGTVYGAEVTLGSNGWHYHRHILAAHSRNMTAEEMQALQAEVSRWWAVCVRKFLGAAHVPTVKRGARWTIAPQGEKYIAKLGLEVSDVGLKKARAGSRNQWDLLYDASQGDAEALERFGEYSAGMQGKKAVQFSDTLIEHWRGLGWKREGDTDAELCWADEKRGKLVLEVPGAAWAQLRKRGPRLASLLTAVDADLILEMLQDLTKHTPEVWKVKPGHWGSGACIKDEARERAATEERRALRAGLDPPDDAERRRRLAVERAGLKAAQDGIVPW